MHIIDYIASANTRIKEAIDTDNHAEAIRLVRVLISTLQDKIKEWETTF
jgi:hypothetical protein